MRPGHVTLTSTSLYPHIVSDSQTFGIQVKIPTDTRLPQLWRCTIKAGELSLTDAGGFHTCVFNLLLFASMIFFIKTFEGVYSRRSKASNKEKSPPPVFFCKWLLSHSQVLLASMLLSVRTHLWLYQNINMPEMINNLH